MLKLRLKEVLAEQGKSAYWLCKQTGISQNSINKMCNNKTIRIDFQSLEKISLALNCSIDYLFDSTDPAMKRLLTYAKEFDTLHSQSEDDIIHQVDTPHC